MVIKKPSKTDRKHAYDQKLCQLLDEYSRVLVASADNVGSAQLAEIRRGIRRKSVMLMGKNTLIRRCISAYATRTGNEKIKAMIPLIKGNVGLIFTKVDLKEVREEVAKYKVVITNVYDDGLVFSPEALDHTEEDLMEKFACGISMVASLSLAVSYPTLAAAPIMFLNGYKDVLAVAVETDYSFPHADQIKEYLLKYRDWASLPSDLLESIFARMGSTFDIMRGPKNVCLAWRNAALWHVFREFFNIPNPTVDAVVEEFRNSHRQTLHSEAGSSDYESNDMFSEYHDDPEEGKHWYFSMYIKDLKKFAAAVLSGAEVAP